MITVKVTAPFFDERGIHKRGEVVEVAPEKFRPEYMVKLADEKVIEDKKEKVEKAVKKEPSKTTRTKKG